MTTSIMIRIMTFYIGSIFFIVWVVRWTSVRADESPFTLALSAMHFGWAGAAMTALILSRYFAVELRVFVCSRVRFVLAERGDAPDGLVRTDARRMPRAATRLDLFVSTF